VSDITCLRTLGGWACLTVIPGLFDRKVIGRTLSSGMETVHTAIPALETAFASLKVREGLISRSDRGRGIALKAFANGRTNFVLRFAGA
jgi:transposase InsO family protein